MKITIIKKKLFWVVLYAVALIIGSQLWVDFEYKDLNASVDKFIELEIDAEKIVAITEHQYTPGKGDYKMVETNAHAHLPLLVENQDMRVDSIMAGQFLSKKQNDTHFIVTSNSQTQDFIIRTLDAEIKHKKIFLFVIGLAITIVGLFKYGIEVSK